MDINNLTRDSAKVATTLKELPNEALITTTGCFIQIPSKYVDKQLANLSKQGTYILGVFALITPDGNYSVFNFPNMVRIVPSETRRFFHDDVEYIEFEFARGAPVIADLNVLVQDTLIYHIYDHYVDGGTVPWFLDYRDFCALFDLVPDYIGVKLGATWTIIKTILAQTARCPGNKSKKFRELLKTNADVAKLQPEYISFSSVLYGPKTTSAKLMGPYFDTALVSSIVNPSDSSDNIEQYYGS